MVSKVGVVESVVSVESAASIEYVDMVRFGWSDFESMVGVLSNSFGYSWIRLCS